jgi:S-methylmethionine-dependent homocysteine/selenocysteine methylase
MDQMVTEYKELIALQQNRVDGFLAETISSVSEATAALTAAKQSQYPHHAWPHSNG